MFYWRIYRGLQQPRAVALKFWGFCPNPKTSSSSLGAGLGICFSSSSLGAGLGICFAIMLELFQEVL